MQTQSTGRVCVKTKNDPYQTFRGKVSSGRAMRRSPHDNVLAAIDVGSNAVKLKLVRPLPDGSFALLHQERDPVRPGEEVFTSGVIPARSPIGSSPRSGA